MKIYKKYDIENAFNSGRGYGVPDDIKDFNSFIQSITPISLPSNEDIEQGSRDYIKGTDLDRIVERTFFIAGVKWYKKQILNQNK
jgi:hypothetical protein